MKIVPNKIYINSCFTSTGWLMDVSSFDTLIRDVMKYFFEYFALYWMPVVEVRLSQ